VIQKKRLVCRLEVGRQVAGPRAESEEKVGGAVDVAIEGEDIFGEHHLTECDTGGLSGGLRIWMLVARTVTVVESRVSCSTELRGTWTPCSDHRTIDSWYPLD
jgi:hypothetical protein